MSIEDDLTEKAKILEELGMEPTTAPTHPQNRAPTKDASGWEDRLVNRIVDSGYLIEDWDLGHPHRHIPVVGDAANPFEMFLNSIVSGRLTPELVYCRHVISAVVELILVRSSKAWILGCQPCVRARLDIQPQDSRCDWCGRQPQISAGAAVVRRPVIVFTLGHASLVVSLCPACRLKVESSVDDQLSYFRR